MADRAALAATRTRLVTRAGQAAPAGLADPAVRAVATPVARADPADRVTIQADRAGPVGRVGPVDLATTLADLVAPAGRVSTQAALAAPADRVTTQAAPVARADPVGPANAVVPIPTRADPGMATRSVATSAGLRGATVRDRGALALRRDPTGAAGRFLRPVGNGVMARSTTGATRKPPFGTPVSTHGASGSSESGSRCKEQ